MEDDSTAETTHCVVFVSLCLGDGVVWAKVCLIKLLSGLIECCGLRSGSSGTGSFVSPVWHGSSSKPLAVNSRGQGRN